MKNKKGNVVVIALIIVIVAITAGVVGWMFAKKTQAPVQQAVVIQSAPAKQTQPIAQNVINNNEIRFSKLILSIPQGLKTVESNGDISNTTNNLPLPRYLLVVPSDFNGYNPGDQIYFSPEPALNEIGNRTLTAYKIPFATLVTEDLPENIGINGNIGVNDISSLLRLELLDSGPWPDGLIMSHSLIKNEIVGKNLSGDNIYAYDYTVNGTKNKNVKAQPMQEFSGALWVHEKKVYILQDQTQSSATWGEKFVGTTSSLLREKIQSIALSSKISD